MIPELFSAAGVEYALHVTDLDEPAREVAIDADTPVVLASTWKILLVTEFARQSVAGHLDPAERTRVTAADRLGGLATAGCADDVDMSWRDLALFAMSFSDNTAADVLLRRVGLDTVQALATELGLAHTRVLGGPRYLIESMFRDVGAANDAEFAAIFPTLPPDRRARLAVLDPARTTASTPRDMTRLLAHLWHDTAGPPEACGQVRALMARQASWHRLASGFPEDVTVFAKSGTVLGVRNEVGVAAYPDGRRYALAVFTRGAAGLRRPDIDAAIGAAAHHAVTTLR